MALPLIQSPILSSLQKLQHGFTTRNGGASSGPYASLNLGWSTGDDEDIVEENYKRLAESFHTKPESFIGVRQVHDGNVIRAQSLDQRQEFMRTDADALITDRPGLFLCIRVADCLPILMIDPVKSAIAAVHAGWRGTLARALTNTIEMMGSEFGSSPEELRVAIGPGIGICCFEVALGVSALFEQELNVSEKEIRQKDATANLDLSEINVRLAKEAGVRADRISQVKECTKCHPEKYYSYRRDGKRSGRQVGFVALVESA